MGKKLIITEKPSVAREFARVLGEPMKNHGEYLESENYIITWCVGHLVTMSYPDAYDEKYKRWSMDTIPFIPQEPSSVVTASLFAFTYSRPYEPDLKAA